MIGIDDWAFRRGRRYGTIIVDLERRRTLALLPDRESGTVEAWLSAHPEITIVARDRGGVYGQATTRALPDAGPDRRLLALDGERQRRFPRRCTLVDAGEPKGVGRHDGDPERLTRAERLQYEAYLRREATSEAILALSQQGVPIKMVARTTDHSRKLVRNVVRGLTGDVFRSRQSGLDAHLPWLEGEWKAGCRNGTELWRRLRARGFTGSLRVVGEWATRRRRSEQVPDGAPARFHQLAVSRVC